MSLISGIYSISPRYSIHGVVTLPFEIFCIKMTCPLAARKYVVAGIADWSILPVSRCEMRGSDGPRGDKSGRRHCQSVDIAASERYNV